MTGGQKSKKVIWDQLKGFLYCGNEMKAKREKATSGLLCTFILPVFSEASYCTGNTGRVETAHTQKLTWREEAHRRIVIHPRAVKGL